MSNILKTNKMKKLFVLSNLVIVLLSSCVTQKTSTYSDDVYANPKEDRIEEARLAAIAKQEREAREKRYNDSIAAVKQAQKEKDDANPYYKDREFKYDDYYDYEYATRVKRFNNGINGLSYYDNYYTNSYWYSGNPYNYGISVYNGYSWWGSSYNSYSYNPSISFYSSWGWGYGNQFGCYSGYNPYMAGYMQGYNNGFYNGFYGGNYYGYGNPYGYGMYGYGYNPYGYGYPYGYGGWGNPYNNGWGYYNSYDSNSSYTYGPRSSHGGGNSRRVSNPGVNNVNDDSYFKKYTDEIADKQDRAVKFEEIAPIKNNGFNNPIRVDKNGKTYSNESMNQNPAFDNDNNNPAIRNGATKKTEVIGPPKNNIPTKNTPVIKESVPVKQNPGGFDKGNTKPVKQQMEAKPMFETPKQNSNYQTPSSPGNNGGGNKPVNNGGSRPR